MIVFLFIVQICLATTSTYCFRFYCRLYLSQCVKCFTLPQIFEECFLKAQHICSLNVPLLFLQIPLQFSAPVLLFVIIRNSSCNYIVWGDGQWVSFPHLSWLFVKFISHTICSIWLTWNQVITCALDRFNVMAISSRSVGDRYFCMPNLRSNS